MFQNLDVFQTSASMARHAAARQAVISQNTAHADTPGYQPLVMPTFQEAFRAGTNRLHVSRPSHINGPGLTGLAAAAGEAEPAPNGNAVSLELEMLHGVDAQREHSRALTIYQHAMTVIRATVAR